jgi:hypothetical protein
MHQSALKSSKLENHLKSEKRELFAMWCAQQLPLENINWMKTNKMAKITSSMLENVKFNMKSEKKNHTN